MVKRGEQDAKGKGFRDTKMTPQSKNDKGMSAQGAKKFGDAIAFNVMGGNNKEGKDQKGRMGRKKKRGENS
jgi:hypothetical protein